jgi:hypothetical protein
MSNNFEEKKENSEVRRGMGVKMAAMASFDGYRNRVISIPIC